MCAQHSAYPTSRNVSPIPLNMRSHWKCGNHVPIELTNDSCAILSVYDLRKYLLAGNSKLTILFERTGIRYTFKVRTAKTQSGRIAWNVSILKGPDNEHTGSYAWIGQISKASNTFRTGRISSETRFAQGAGAFAYLARLAGLHTNTMLAMPYQKADDILLDGDICKIWRANKCGRCGRTLTTPKSIVDGYGPECVNYV